MILILKCFKHTPNKINLNNTKLFSNLPYRGTFTTNVSNKFIKLKEWWHNKFINPNKTNVLEDVKTDQQYQNQWQYLEKIQDERREIGKHITDVRKLFIEKQDKIFQINKWDNVQQYVFLRKEEAELIKKEYELTAKFEALDKTEKELFTVLGNKIRGSYEREKEKSKYTKVWVTIITIVIILFSETSPKISTNVKEKPSLFSKTSPKISTNVEEKPSYFTINNLENHTKKTLSYITDNNLENHTKNTALWGGFGLAAMLLICCCCCCC